VRHSGAEKLEIIRLVEGSDLSVSRDNLVEDNGKRAGAGPLEVYSSESSGLCSGFSMSARSCVRPAARLFCIV
jgi:hypothetical protein